MSDYSIISFLKSLAENDIEEAIFELFSKDSDNEEILDYLLKMKRDNDDQI